MLFLPQGHKSGKMLSESGSTPMESASLSDLSEDLAALGRAHAPTVAAVDGAALLHLPPRLCSPPYR